MTRSCPISSGPGSLPKVVDRVGLAPDGDLGAVRWVAVRHAADHVHIVATLARQDGGRPDVWNDGYRVRDACRAVEQRYGLRRTAPADRTAARPGEPGRDRESRPPRPAATVPRFCDAQFRRRRPERAAKRSSSGGCVTRVSWSVSVSASGRSAR